MESASPAQPSPESRLEATLREAPIVALDQVAVGSNAVFRAQLRDRGGELLAIYKPARGERPLWDFPVGTLHRREVAASLVDRALGWDFTPCTVVRRQAPLGVGSMQALVAGPIPELELDRERLEGRLRGLATLDVVLNNADRKSGHLLVDSAGELRAIDNGLTFNTEFKLRTVLADLGGSPVPPEWLEGLRRLLANPARLGPLRRRLGRLLAKEEVAAFERRSQRLLAAGTFPQLHPWYGRPFEW